MKIFICFTILVLIYLLYKCNKRFIKKNKNIENFENNKSNKPYLWLYWEEVTTTPAYIDMCYETVIKHCSKDFNIIRLNEKTVYDYLPDLKFKVKNLPNFKNLNIPQKTDYYRYNLLYKYGGIWLDSDIIVFSSLLPLYKHLNKTIDYVGAGCHSKSCIPNGAPYPANWILISKPKTQLMSLMIDGCDKVLGTKGKINYHNIGRNLLWKNIEYLQKNQDWTYYHIPSKCFERDTNDNKYVNKRLISDEDMDPQCKNLIFIPIYNTAPGFPVWFKNMNKQKILDSNLLISKLFKKSLY